MKVQELIDRLSDYDPDEEVMLAFQPSWPLAYHVSDVVGNSELDHDEEYVPEDDSFNGVVWIVEGGQNYDHPYAPSAVFNY